MPLLLEVREVTFPGRWELASYVPEEYWFLSRLQKSPYDTA